MTLKLTKILGLGALTTLALALPALAQDAAVPVPDKGDTTWMLISTILVITMTIDRKSVV